MSEYEKRILDLKVEEELERMIRRLHELADSVGVEHIEIGTNSFQSSVDGKIHRSGIAFTIYSDGHSAMKQLFDDGDLIGLIQEARDREKTE